MRLSLRAVLLTLIALVAIGGLVSVLPSGVGISKNWHEGSCKNEQGVTLVVDFGSSSNRDTLIRCAKGFSATGWDIFAATETAVVGTSQYPTGFVCRVEDLPNQDEQPCTSTPTYDQGNWAYFNASQDSEGKWMFSSTGSQLRSPKCGSAEGWRFVEPKESQTESMPRVLPQTFRCD